MRHGASTDAAASAGRACSAVCARCRKHAALCAFSSRYLHCLTGIGSRRGLDSVICVCRNTHAGHPSRCVSVDRCSMRGFFKLQLRVSAVNLTLADSLPKEALRHTCEHSDSPAFCKPCDGDAKCLAVIGRIVCAVSAHPCSSNRSPQAHGRSTSNAV